MTQDSSSDWIDRHALRLAGDHLTGRSFLLGDRAGFSLYLPVAANKRDATLQGIKWYGASNSGRSFFEGFVTWVEVDGEAIPLDGSNQTEFRMHLDHAVRVFQVAGREVIERYFVPNHMGTVVLTLEGDFTFGVRPEFDMRYYQAFDTDFSSYGCEQSGGDVVVRNTVRAEGPLHDEMQFAGAVRSLEESSIEFLDPDLRLVHKTYLKDEARAKAVESVYSETDQRMPDEAPIWDQYETEVYSPVRFRGQGAITLVCVFGADESELRSRLEYVSTHLEHLRAEKREVIAGELSHGLIETGNTDVDDAYAHVLTRFNECLVVRDAVLRVADHDVEHQFAVYAGNKYFMDPWKRDENISLQALLTTSDYETVRAILDSTWQFQHERTGRLPQIVRAGEPLVYYSSDGTLWAVHRLFEYTRESGDATLLAAKLEMVQHFFRASMSFAQRGLLPSGGIVDPKYLWETWEDTPFTPREGFPIEIELLWLTVLEEWSAIVGDRALEQQMRAVLIEGKATFERFGDPGYIVDRLGRDWQPDPILTPNGYLAFDLGFELDCGLERNMVEVARDQLAGRRGVRSLAPRDWPAVFPKAFLDDPRSHTGKNMASFGIFNYHRGIEWEWFNAAFVAGELKWGSAHQAFTGYVRGQVDEALHEAGIGGLSELHDEHGQLGADFQAWSMAALIESLHRFAGIDVDAGGRSVCIAPSIPPEWPYLRTRFRVGQDWFELRYSEPSVSERRLVLATLGSPSEPCTVSVGIDVGSRGTVRESSCNGRPIPSGEWTYAQLELDGKRRRARIVLSPRDELELHVFVSQTNDAGPAVPSRGPS